MTISPDDQPMTPEEIGWVRNQRITEVPEDEECRALPTGSGTCAYAGPDGKDACGVKCIYRGERR